MRRSQAISGLDEPPATLRRFLGLGQASRSQKALKRA
jgi:hypothetical protein